MTVVVFSRCVPTMALLTIMAVVPGCGGSDPNGPGSYAAVMESQKSAEDKLAAHGAKVERKEFPLGSAFVIDLSGKEISDEVFAALKSLDRIAELNLSGSTLSDAHIPKLNELGMVLYKLNISKTSISDQGLPQLVCGFLKQLDVTGSQVTQAGVAAFLKARAENKEIAEGFKKVTVKL